MIPVDRSIILRKIEPSPALPTILDPTNNPSDRPSEHSPEAFQPIVDSNLIPQPIPDFTVQEIDDLQIISTKLEIERQESIVHATLPTNDPVPWGLKRVVSNLATCAARGLTPIAQKEHQIETLQQQWAEMKAKKAVNRTRILAEGKPWINRDDIKTFFESQMTEAHRTAKRKYETAQQLSSTRKAKLAHHTHKRKEVERLEEEGKLPKGRKPGATLLKVEGHLVQLIWEADDRVQKLEKDIDELAKNMKSEDVEQIVRDTESDEYFEEIGADATPVPMIVDEFVE